MTDDKSAIMIGDLQDNDNQIVDNSTIMIAELQDYTIDVYQAIKIPETKDFPIEDFFKLPFTHHIRILERVEDLSARYYYIHSAVEENLQSRTLEKLLAEDAYSHRDINVEQIGERESIGIVLCKSANREYVEFVIRDYNKPMGVATYKTSAEMPEELRKAMPDIEELKKLL